MNAHGTFIGYELPTTNPEGAADFYGKVVGRQARSAGQPA
jgi:predicted enzyme related to lactoylglutathione lyase